MIDPKEKQAKEHLDYLVNQYALYWRPIIDGFKNATGLSKTQAILFLNLYITNGLTRAIYSGNEANEQLRRKALEMFDEGNDWKNPLEDDEEKDHDDGIV